MNYFRIKVTLTIFTVLFPLIVHAGGSSYSRYGFGDILRYGDSQIYAMGGTGIALVDDGSINLLNPAGMSRISFTRFSAGFEYDGFSSKDSSGSSFYSTGGLQGLAFAFPISQENGIVMSIEATPYSKVNYAISSSNFDTLSGSVQHQTFYGSGGLSYLGLGLSGSPLNTLHLGARLNYMYGSTRQYQTSSFDSSYYTSTTFDRTIYYSGFTFTLGAIYEGIDQLLGLPSLHNLSLGLTLTTASSLDANIERIYSEGDTTNQNGTDDIPLSAGFGLSYLYQNRYRFLGDFVFENWGNLKPFALDPVSLRNSYRTSIGFEAIPEKGADTYWKRIFYRAGFAYNSTYYQINGVGINEVLMSGGVGLPMGPESWINIGLQVGLRGTTDNNLQKDIIVRLSVAVSASELWFLKFDEE
ncbi:MAG: hypothetical protein ABSA44_06105 [Bacteroidota bacterium]|jgi:hypothetical protein